MVSRDMWDTMKHSPRSLIYKTFGEKVVHSTYGWQEVRFDHRKQTESEILLQGFLRAPEKSIDEVMKLSGKDGIFVDRLTNERRPRPNVWWIQIKEGEDMPAYLARASAEAKKENCSMCFRKGGSTCLGLRLQDSKHLPQLHAWTLHGAPRHWFGQDVMQCLFDAGCTEAEIIRPPGKQKAWLVKAIVPDEHGLGVMAIQAGSRVLYLNRVQNRQRKSAEVMSVIRSKYQARGTQINKDVPPNKPAPPPRERSRSPSKDKKDAKDSKESQEKPGDQQNVKSKEAGPFAKIADRVISLDCGGAGNCGYNCLAAGLALDKGESFDNVKDLLEARGRTVRNDIYKHLEKHKSDYSPFFTPAESNENIDAGPSPQNWEEFLECTLREGRWIDGISLKAASKRFGIQLIVVPLVGEAKDEPMSFGTPRAGREPIVLLLNDQQGHYTLAKLKEGRQWPKGWTEAPPASVDNPAFRGGGKAPSVASQHSWRTAATPASSRPRQSGPSQSSKWRPASTPHTKVKTKPKSASVKSPNRHSWRCAATPRTLATSRSRQCLPAPSQPASVVGIAAKKQESSGLGLLEQFVWTCNLCHQVFRRNKKKSLASARLRHIAKEHRSKRKAVHPCFLPKNKCLDPIAEASDQIPADQRAWSCPKCGKGLGFMAQFLLKKGRDNHIMKCYGYTLAKLRKLRYKNPIWIQNQRKMSKQNAANKLCSTVTALKEYNEKTKAGAFRIPPEFLSQKTKYGYGFSCGTCTITYQSLSKIKAHKCTGHKGRASILGSPGRKRLWLRCRTAKDQKAATSFFIKSWKITCDELEILEKRLKGCNGVPPLKECSWIRDLCEDGDIESNPGPSSSIPVMSASMMNVGGQENAWAFARSILADRPAIAIIQEHCMIPDKCADLARFMQQNGYRSWFAAPPATRHARGHMYTTGGVAIFVRCDKGARLIQSHVANDGQALLLQLEHAYVVGAYLPPGGTLAEDSITVLDEWVASCGAAEPVFLCGDFNQEPEFANRWTALATRGACHTVRNALNAQMPTRWEGKRCIDWVWASHPHMLTNIDFSDLVIADHRAISFTLQYSQDCVQSFRQVPTRSLLRPENVNKDQWDAATQAVWQTAECPAESSTQQEWNEFCATIEQKFDEVISMCASSHGHRRFIRPKGSAMQVRVLEPATFRLKQHASCRELKVRKLLGRVKEANLQISRHGSAPAVLIARVWNHPLVRNQDFQSLRAIEQWAEAEVLQVVKQDRLAKIQAWRQNMRTDMSKARKWITKQNTLPVTSVHEQTYKNDVATCSSQDSAAAIASFWRTIWNRQLPQVDEAFEAWQRHTPARPEMPWRPLSAKELHDHAQRQKDSAAGPDGLSGTEISQLPYKAWHILAELLDRWTNRSELPQVWQSTRQVHLQKPDAKLRHTDGAIDAKDLRPISIQCTIWRVIASSWTRRQSTRTWINAWVHPTACGGMQGRGVAKAVDVLFQKFEKGPPQSSALAAKSSTWHVASYCENLAGIIGVKSPEGGRQQRAASRQACGLVERDIERGWWRPDAGRSKWKRCRCPICANKKKVCAAEIRKLVWERAGLMPTTEDDAVLKASAERLLQHTVNMVDGYLQGAGDLRMNGETGRTIPIDVSFALIHPSLDGFRSYPGIDSALYRFKQGEVRVLVATDLASRGLDVRNCAIVVNFDAPKGQEDYVHRIGRTGRAEDSGEAYTLLWLGRALRARHRIRSF
eukprot:s1814_g2.t1